MNQRTNYPTGITLLHDPEWNKGTAFTAEERDALYLRGLIPPRICSLTEQVRRVMDNFTHKSSDLEKYIYMIALEDRNETLFYRVVLEHLDKMMPIIYTPTVGQGCQEYGHIFRRPRGLYISAEDKGHVAQIVANWPHDDVRVIVVTDGERILGLGDLGANGMGIPVGKLSLYTACAGVHPSLTLPITLDVGTNNEALLADPLYIGLPRQRLRGPAYEALIEEFITAVTTRYPHAIIQFEDFGTNNAFHLLETYRRQVCCFNDDIQGTASMALAGLYSALRITGGALRDQKLLFLGAGQAGTGIANLVVSAMVEEGLSEIEAQQHCWFVDLQGLVVSSREDLMDYQRPFAHDYEFLPDFFSAVQALKPTAIIGACGQPSMFTQPILEAMTQWNERPIIFSLSNPTSKSECTAEEAYCWTDGRAIFASGSPFDPVTFNGQTFIPAQANNAYIFPGVGLGVLVSEARLVTDEMFMAAAKTLAAEVAESDLANGRIYPPLSKIRDVSAKIATVVATIAYQNGLTIAPEPKDLPAMVRSHMYEPDYQNHLFK